MCRSTDFPHFGPSASGDHRLDLKAFYVRFSGPRCTPQAQDIPEERESVSESDGGGRCCCEGDRGSEGRDDEEDGVDGEDWAVNTEGVRWAVDVGIWVACLGVGFLVSKASAKSLRRRRLLR